MTAAITSSTPDPPAERTYSSSAHAKLPSPFSSSPTSEFDIITQGAEAIVFKTAFLTPEISVALKVRPAKHWRHPTLDRQLTRQRILAEARVLVKCRRDGIVVPMVLGMDWDRGWLACEWIDGVTVKDGIRRWASATGPEASLKQLLSDMGTCIGKLHAVGVVHGDLTTSNMMIRSSVVATPSDPNSPSGTKQGRDHDSMLQGDLVLIDFGLATQTVQDEDRAVDLYVLERAFGSTHPKQEYLFPDLLEAYAGSYKGAKTVLRRLDDVRMRGRKKSMIG